MQWIVKTYNHLKWTSNTYKLTSCSTRRRTYSLEVTNHAQFFSSKETITQRGAKDVYFLWNEGSDWSMAKIWFGLSMLNSFPLYHVYKNLVRQNYVGPTKSRIPSDQCLTKTLKYFKALWLALFKMKFQPQLHVLHPNPKRNIIATW